MPGMDGIETLHTLRSVSKETNGMDNKYHEYTGFSTDSNVAKKANRRMTAKIAASIMAMALVSAGSIGVYHYAFSQDNTLSTVIIEDTEDETVTTTAVSDVTIKNVIPKHLESISAKLLEMGCQVLESDDAVRVVATKRMRNVHVKTLPYPGYPTDMQPQITVALGLASGISLVTESLFENRLKPTL